MTVARLAVDRTSNTPVVILREAVGDRGVAIWIGAPEAAAISLALAGDTPPRPITHDLAAALVAALGGSVRQVTITGVRDGTYYAVLEVASPDGTTRLLDARPSDAIALALRTDAPLLAAPDLLRTDGAPPAEAPEPLDAEALRAHLRRLAPEDFGRFQP